MKFGDVYNHIHDLFHTIFINLYFKFKSNDLMN